MHKLPRGIKKEARPLLQKSLNSLTLSIELFNRPSDLGRTDTVLILLDHAIEMLLKASILHRGAKIRDAGMVTTIGFEKCVDRACSHPACGFISLDEARGFKAINLLRDAAQHYFLDVSEEQLYIHVQSGVSLIRDILKRVFGIDLIDCLPRRVLPISTVALSTIEVLYDEKIDEVRKMLGPGKRQRQEAIAALMPLLILDRSIRGQDDQPSERDLERAANRIQRGENWLGVFPGVETVEFATDGHGPSLSLRIDKKEGIPMVIVSPETEGAAVVLKRVDEFGYYNLMAKQVAQHLGISRDKFLALAAHLKLQDDPECFKVFQLSEGNRHKRYSRRALDRARAEMQQLTEADWVAIWNTYRRRRSNSRRSA